MKVYKWVWLVLQSIFAIGAYGADAPNQRDTRLFSDVKLTIAAGTKGTAYDIIATELATQIRSKCHSCDIKVVSTEGGIQNLQMIRDGTADIGLANVSAAWEASIGSEVFGGKPIPVRALSVLYPNSMHLLVKKDLHATKLSDLAGKRIATGAPGSGTEVISMRMISAVGFLPDRDIFPKKLGLIDAIRALKANELDGLIFGAAVPIKPIGDTLELSNYELVPTDDTIKGMTRLFTYVYRPGAIPENTYQNQAKAVGSLDVWDMLVTSDRLPASIAQLITQTIFENRDNFIQAHPAMKYLQLQVQPKIATISFHIGTQRYFAAQGIQPFARQLAFAIHGK